jgi:hypothetical protein
VFPIELISAASFKKLTLAVARGSLMCRSLGEDAFRLKGGNVQLRILAGC